MYFRTKKFKNKDGKIREYLYIVDSKREGDKIKQKNVLCVGRLDEENHKVKINKLAEGLLRIIKDEKIKKEACEQLSLGFAKELGPTILFKHLWRKLNIDTILRNCFPDCKNKDNYIKAIYLMVLNRLCEPESKLGVDRWKNLIYDEATNGVKLHHFYKSLDHFYKHKEKIEEELFDRMKDLFNMEVDIVFIDTTSLKYYGIFAPSAEYGYSKDHRGDLKQFVMAMVVTKEGYPISHEVFPGNTSDKKLFLSFIQDIKRRFNLGKVILVEDSGFFSKEIEDGIKELGVEYIVKAPMSGDRKEYAKSNEVFFEISTDDETHFPLTLGSERNEDGIREVLVYDLKKCEADSKKRDELFRKLVVKLSKSSAKDFIKNRGYKKYLSNPIDGFHLNVSKLEEEKFLDGKYILRTNSNLPMKDVIICYKRLNVIEQSFRYLKSPLEVAPMFHMRENRIRAHVSICVLAYLLEIIVVQDLREIQNKLNYPEILSELRQLKLAEVCYDGNTFLVRNDVVGDVGKLFAKMGVRLPNKIIKI